MQEEIPILKIYGFDTGFQLEYLEENVRWILRKFMKKSGFIYEKEEKIERGDSTESPLILFYKKSTLQDVN